MSERNDRTDAEGIPADQGRTEEGEAQAEDQEGSLKVHGDKLEELIPTDAPQKPVDPK